MMNLCLKGIGLMIIQMVQVLLPKEIQQLKVLGEMGQMKNIQ